MAPTTKFSLEGKALKLTTAADIEPHIKELKDNADVEEVVFVGNTLGIEACKALGDALKDKKKLNHANFADIFTGRLIEEIPEALDHLLSAILQLPHVHTINLSDNAFGSRMGDQLAAFLSSYVPLQHLILNNNGLGPEAGAKIATALAQLAEKKKSAASSGGGDAPNLETVVCGRNRLENGSMEAWAKAYTANDGIKVVRMVQNGIRQDGIFALFTNGLGNCKELEILDLQDNTFTVKGAGALSKVVGNMAKLRELGVGDCLLGARGGVVLAEALNEGKNKELKVLRLQYNEIDAKGLQAFRDTVKASLPKLELLELNGNKFSEEDPIIEQIRDIFEERGLGELDSLSDMEEESDEEDEDEQDKEDEEEEEQRETIVKDADKAENTNVPLEKDKAVDELADLLGKKAEIK